MIIQVHINLLQIDGEYWLRPQNGHSVKHISIDEHRLNPEVYMNIE